MSISKKMGLHAAAAAAAAVTAVTSLALAPVAEARTAPSEGQTVTVTLRVRPDSPRGFDDSFGTSIIRANGLGRASFCDYLDAGPVTVKTVTAQVGERISIMPTAGCYLITNASQVYTVTASTTVIDVALPAVF